MFLIGFPNKNFNGLKKTKKTNEEDLILYGVDALDSFTPSGPEQTGNINAKLNAKI